MAKRNLMQRMLQHLKGRRHLHVPTTMTFPPLEPVEIREERELEKRGRERGAQNLPPAHSKAFDDVEREIIALVEHRREVAGHYLHDNLSTYEDRLNSLDLHGAATDIGVEARKMLMDFTTELSHGADQVYAARQRVVEQDRHLKNFRRQAHLERPAHYPSSHILHFGVLVALFVVEMALNGMFLGETHVLGLLGGFTEAIVIAAVNVGLGAVAGYGALRQCWHRAPWRKAAGIFGLALYLGAILIFNLGAAHYRDALAAGDWDMAAATAREAVVANPLSVADVKSWLLFAMGLFFSLIALVDGFRMDDPYPGYGPNTRRLMRAQRSYALIKATCLEELAAIKDEAVDAMVATKKELAKAQGEYWSILEARQRYVRQYTDHLRGLEGVANTLLASYRNANRCKRNEPAPRRFDEHWQMVMPAAPVSREPDLPKMERSVQRANQALEEHIANVQTEFGKAVRAFQRIEELSEEELERGSAQTVVQAASVA